MIANELKEVFSPAVKGSADDMEDIVDNDGNVTGQRIHPMRISPASLIPVLIKSVQELSAEVTNLKAEIESLKS